jgi:hypothetical protein
MYTFVFVDFLSLSSLFNNIAYKHCVDIGNLQHVKT